MSIKIGAQTVTWGENVRANMRQIVTFLSQEEYQGVETGMRHFDPEQPRYYRELYAESGIVPLGLHSGGQFWLPDAAQREREKLNEAVRFACAVGFQWVVVSGNKEETPDSIVSAAKTYREIGHRCAEHGIGFAYHNHNWELEDDGRILTRLVENTGPEVSLVLDIAWAHVAGFDQKDLFSRYASRIAYVHVKDVRDKRFCELGTGEVDLTLCITQVQEYDIPWIVVEQDYTDLAVEQSMQINRTFLRQYDL